MQRLVDTLFKKLPLRRHLDGKNYFVVENTQVIGSVGDIPPPVEEELIMFYNWDNACSVQPSLIYDAWYFKSMN